VSVIVATRNRATLLPEALASLAAQRCASSFEIVVVDNGSDDTTVDVVREWERRDERMRSVFEPEIGLSRAKNAGIRAARGRLIMFTDDDVIVPEQWIATYVDFFSRSPATRVVAGGPVLPVASDSSNRSPNFTAGSIEPEAMMPFDPTRAFTLITQSTNVTSASSPNPLG